jgi:hypothetical protein
MGDINNHGAILVATLSGFWWGCNLLAYRYIQMEAQPYRIFWWFSFLSLGVVCLLSSLELGGVIQPVNGATILALMVWVSLFGGLVFGTLVWIVWKGYRQPESKPKAGESLDQATIHLQSLGEIKVVI